jgi:magnesium transporter
MATQLASATDQLWDRWPYLSHEQRLKQFRELHTGEKADFFLALNAHDQYNLSRDHKTNCREEDPA